MEEKQTSLQTQVKEYIDAVATQKALASETLAKDITDRKTQELLNSADAKLKAEQAENKNADVKIQEAEFDTFRGIAEYAGIKRSLPRKMQQLIFSILSIYIGIIMILLCPITCAINVTIEQIDSIVNKINAVAKSVRRIVVTMLALGLIAILCLVIYKLIK
jgi:hypothetical protein